MLIKILIMPGTEWQTKLCKKIVEMGYSAIVVSPEENPPGKKISTKYLRSDIFDLDRIERFCREEKVDALISDECDIAMPVIAELGDRLGLCTLTKEDAELYTDKYKMREFCRLHGLCIPDYTLCRELEDGLEFFRKSNGKIIIKPINSNASHGVFTITSETELKEHFQQAGSFSRGSDCVLAERYIDGTEFTIDGIKTPDAHFTLAISEKKHYKHNPNIANELLFTHYSNTYDYNELKAVNDKFVMESGLRFGFTHAEYKYENGKYYLIEIAARGGGNMISGMITQYLSGYDTYRYLIRCSLGEVESEEFNIREEYKNRSAVLKFFETPGGGGVVDGIDGLDYLSKEKCIFDYKFNFKPGDVIREAENDSVRVGYYIAGAENSVQLKEVMAEVDNVVKIRIRNEAES